MTESGTPLTPENATSSSFDRRRLLATLAQALAALLLGRRHAGATPPPPPSPPAPAQPSLPRDPSRGFRVICSTPLVYSTYSPPVTSGGQPWNDDPPHPQAAPERDTARPGNGEVTTTAS